MLVIYSFGDSWALDFLSFFKKNEICQSYSVRVMCAAVMTIRNVFSILALVVFENNTVQ